MQISIVGRRVEITDAIRDYVEKRLAKLKKYFPNTVDVHVVLFTQKIKQAVEITINADGFVIHGEEASEDLYTSIDLLMDKLDAQLRKHKERMKLHRRKGPRPDKNLNLNISVFEREDLEDMNPSPGVIHTKQLVIKPMSVDEAVLQMDLIGQDFLVFLDATSQRMNVLYRRKDGNYGLIEPDY